MRVLIVDDYPGLVELYDFALRARGMQVTGATTANEAITLAATQPFDAVVLDMELPDGSGTQLLARLRGLPTLRGAAFVGMSSYEQPIPEFDAFLAKPFHPKRLASVLRRLAPPAPCASVAHGDR